MVCGLYHVNIFEPYLHELLKRKLHRGSFFVCVCVFLLREGAV